MNTRVINCKLVYEEEEKNSCGLKKKKKRKVGGLLYFFKTRNSTFESPQQKLCNPSCVTLQCWDLLFKLIIISYFHILILYFLLLSFFFFFSFCFCFILFPLFLFLSFFLKAHQIVPISKIFCKNCEVEINLLHINEHQCNVSEKSKTFLLLLAKVC